MRKRSRRRSMRKRKRKRRKRKRKRKKRRRRRSRSRRRRRRMKRRKRRRRRRKKRRKKRWRRRWRLVLGRCVRSFDLLSGLCRVLLTVSGALIGRVGRPPDKLFISIADHLIFGFLDCSTNF